MFTALKVLLTSCFVCDNSRRHWSPGADIHDENVVWQSQDAKEEVTDVLKYHICHCTIMLDSNNLSDIANACCIFCLHLGLMFH